MGIQINGQTDTISAFDNNFSLAGNVSIGGTLTYEDVTSVDAVGLSTFKAGIRVTGGSAGIGTDNPDRKLVISQANSTAYSGTDFDQDYHVLKLNNTTDSKTVGMQFLIGSNGEAAITATETSDGATDLIFGTRGGGNRAERVRINAAGLVGIGTDNPTTALEVKGDITVYNTNNQGDIFFGEHGDVSDSKALIRMDQVNSTNGELQFHIEGSGTLAERLRITSDGYARLTTANARLEWTASSGSNPFIRSIGSGQQELEFNTGGSERLRITAAGSVGIGTNNPGDKLSIYTSPNALVIGCKDTTRGNHIFQLLADDGPGNGELRLYRNSATGTHEKTVEIAASGNSYFTGGNIGINRTNPDQKLNVSGCAEFNAYDSGSGSGGYYTSKGLIIGNLYDAGKSYTGSDDRNACIWQERGLDLDFATNDALRMKISYDGKIVIGGYGDFVRGNLQVVDGGGGELNLGRFDTTVSQYNDIGHIFFTGNAGSSGHAIGGISCYAAQNQTATSKPSYLTFNTCDASNPPTLVERLRITENGTLVHYGGHKNNSGGSNLGAGTYYRINASVTIPQNSTKTLTFTGLQTSWMTIRIGGYGNAGSQAINCMYELGGYMTATYTYDVHTVRQWARTGSISTGKNATNFTVTLPGGSNVAGSVIFITVEGTNANIAVNSN